MVPHTLTRGADAPPELREPPVGDSRDHDDATLGRLSWDRYYGAERAEGGVKLNLRVDLSGWQNGGAREGATLAGGGRHGPSLMDVASPNSPGGRVAYFYAPTARRAFRSAWRLSRRPRTLAAAQSRAPQRRHPGGGRRSWSRQRAAIGTPFSGPVSGFPAAGSRSRRRSASLSRPSEGRRARFRRPPGELRRCPTDLTFGVEAFEHALERHELARTVGALDRAATPRTRSQGLGSEVPLGSRDTSCGSSEHPPLWRSLSWHCSGRPSVLPPLPTILRGGPGNDLRSAPRSRALPRRGCLIESSVAGPGYWRPCR